MWSNRWSTMPVPAFPDLRLPRPDRRARLDYMPGTDVPVIRQPFAAGDRCRSGGASRGDAHLLFDVDEDPIEAQNLAGGVRSAGGGANGALEADMVELLRMALKDLEAPDEQLERLGIA